MSRKRGYSEMDPDGAGLEVAPFAQLGRVTYTARFDAFGVAERLALGSANTYYANSLTEDRMFNIDQREMLLQGVGKVKEFRTGGRVGFYSKVFSSMNSLKENANTPKHVVVSRYRLAGVAQSTVRVTGDQPNTEFVAVTTGGTHSLWNSGTERISAGDEIWWDIPDKDAKGNAKGYKNRPTAPRGKIPAVVIRPYRPDVHGPAALKQLDWVRNNNFAEYGSKVSFLDRAQLRKQGHLGVMFDHMMRLVALGTNADVATGALNVDVAQTMGALANQRLRQNVMLFLLDSKKFAGDKSVSFKAAYGNLFSNTVNAFAAHINYIGCRKFGRATTNADPGKLFDAVLGTYRMS